MAVTGALLRLLERARADPDVLAVIRFGSSVRGDTRPGSDVDLCLVLFPSRYDPADLTEKRMAYSQAEGLDVSVFQMLPLYIFSKLEEAGLLSPGFVETLRRMKGFRNILVHEYGRIDERIVYDMATTRLGDFEVFRREVLKALQSLGTTEA